MTRRKWAQIVGMLLVLSALLAGCASSPAGGAPQPTLPVLTLPSPLSSYSIFVTDLSTGDLSELGHQTWHVGQSVHGLGLSPDGKTLYVTNIAANSLVTFDLGSGTPHESHSIDVGPSPVHAVSTRDGSTVFVTNFGGQSVSVIDAHTWTLRGSITTAAQPHSIVISPDGRSVYVGCYGGASIAIIDTTSDSLVTSIPLPLGAEPYGLALSPDGHYLYATDNLTGRLYVVDTQTRKAVTSVPLQLHPALIARSPDGKTLYVANGGGHSVSVVDIGADAAHPTVRKNVPVTGYPHGIAVTPDGRYVVVANTLGKDLSVIDTSTLAVIATISGEQYPNDVLITG